MARKRQRGEISRRNENRQAAQNGLQQGRKERGPRGVLRLYVEGFERPRTTLGGIFSSLSIRHVIVGQPEVVADLVDYGFLHLVDGLFFCIAQTQRPSTRCRKQIGRAHV